MDNRPDLAELEAVHSSLSPEERDELLQCLLVVASLDGETVVQRLEECLLGVGRVWKAEGYIYPDSRRQSG